MKYLKADQLSRITGIIALLLVFALPLLTKQSDAQEAHWSYKELSPNSSLWWRDTPNPDATIPALEEALERVLAHPLFKDRLPERWGILVDGQWQNSSGFFSDTLQTPTGAPAVLFAPAALLDHAHSRSLVAHELMHLVHHPRRPHEESWVREGVALLAEWLVTGKYNPSLGEAFLNPETSLVAELDPRHADFADTARRGAQYGHLLQFFTYIYRLCGGDALVEKLLTSPSPKSGVAFMDEALSECGGFSATFRAFSLARIQQDISRSEGYVVISRLQTVVREERRELPPYSSTAYRIKAGQRCQKDETPWGASRCIRIREM